MSKTEIAEVILGARVMKIYIISQLGISLICFSYEVNRYVSRLPKKAVSHLKVSQLREPNVLLFSLISSLERRISRPAWSASASCEFQLGLKLSR